MTKTGVLFVNLGTPCDPSVGSVRRYLREFLMDPRVIDLPVWLRRLLVYGFILPFRPFKSAKAYQKIWTSQGSPLAWHTKALTEAVSEVLGNDYCVVSAMRYGEPSIAKAIATLADCQHIVVLPLFPQYASAASGSAIAAVLAAYKKKWFIPKLTIINQFYDDSGFIQAHAHQLAPYLKDNNAFLLFSYHGLPQRHIDKGGCQIHCDSQSACPVIVQNNQTCYRAQCYQTSRDIAQVLKIDKSRYTTSFQSRLGRLPWITPYTDDKLIALANEGVQHLVVVCPSFVADCLETLEEIGMAAHDRWQALGGKSFTLVPCLNAQAMWVKAASSIISNVVTS